MSDVRMVKLGDIGQVISGATPKTSVPEYWGGDIYWATPKDLSRLESAYIDSTERTITESGKASCATSILPENSVLLSSRAPIGHVAINTTPMATNQGFKSIIPTNDVIPKYLYYWLSANKYYIQSMGNGATFKEISKKVVESIVLPLPPLEEQKRIVSILDKAKSIQKAHERQLAALDELASSLFISTFPKEDKYNIFKLSEVAKTTSGGTPSRKNPENYGGDILWVKSGELQNGYVTDSEEKITEVGITSSSAKIMPAGTILFAMYGATAGAVAKLGVPAATNQAICCITPNHNLITDTYLMSYLKFRKPDLINMRTGGAQPNLSQSLIRNLDISLPPLEAQKIFSEKIKIIESQRALMRQAANTDNEFFTSVQNTLFDH
ncbi:restriction endonuclease subunit S [Rothia aeria]|jgi:putative type-1 restriction enzyme mjaXP specificity protein